MIEPHTDFDGLWWYAKGKHDPQAFVDAVFDKQGICYPAKSVKHLFGRFVPSSHYAENDFMWFDVEEGRSIRGAYVITCIYTNAY